MEEGVGGRQQNTEAWAHALPPGSTRGLHLPNSKGPQEEHGPGSWPRFTPSLSPRPPGLLLLLYLEPSHVTVPAFTNTFFR